MKREAKLGPSRTVGVARYHVEAAMREIDQALAAIPEHRVRKSLVEARCLLEDALRELREGT